MEIAMYVGEMLMRNLGFDVIMRLKVGLQRAYN